MFERDLLFRELSNLNREYETPADCNNLEWETIKKTFKTQRWNLANKEFREKIYKVIRNAGEDADKWFDNFTQITFLGRKFNNPIHTEFATHLKIIEKKLAKKYSNNDPKKAGDLLQLTTESLKGGRQESGTASVSMHTIGLAMDVNYVENPYLGGTYATPLFDSGEQLQEFIEKLKKQLGVQNLTFNNKEKKVKGKTKKYAEHKKTFLINIIFEHMGLLLNAKKEAYPTGYNYDKRLALFDELGRLNQMLIRYFNLNQAQLDQLLAQSKPNSFWAGKNLKTAADQINVDWQLFCGFVGRWTERDAIKSRGFMKLDRRFVEELELDWGATYGDIMHFDMRNKCIGKTIQNVVRPGNKSSNSNSNVSPRANTNSIRQNVSFDRLRSNRVYAVKLGWQHYVDQINDLLLPFSGQTNVSLGEEAFADALKEWQRKQGLDDDGVLGSGTWAAIKQVLNIKENNTTAPTVPVPSSSKSSSEQQIIDGVRFKKKKSGWAAYGGDKLKTKLLDLKQKGLLPISLNEIETFAIVSIPESGGLINAINSWDSAYMSMGFFQFPIKFGKLQRVIAKAPDAFRKHGIELDSLRKYLLKDEQPIAIKNAAEISDLRSLDWAKRFYRAGLENSVIIAQISVAREILNKLLKEYDKNNYLDRFKDSYPNLWAFIFEAHNSRPAILQTALRTAIKNAVNKNINEPVSFGRILIDQLLIATRNYYDHRKYNENPFLNETMKRKRIEDELEKVGRIIEKTKIIKRT